MKVFYYLLIIIFFAGCSNSSSKLSPDIGNSINLMERTLNDQSEKIKEIEKLLEKYEIAIQNQNKLLEYHQSSEDSMVARGKELNAQFQNALGVLKAKPSDEDLLHVLDKMQMKISILEDRTFYTDSLYFEMINEIVILENRTSSLIASFKEVSELSGRKKVSIIPKITDEEYTSKYIESLSHYQNGEWNLSLDGFRFLIQANMNHDLADNSQYWIGEIYYALNDYRSSIKEFEKVFSFPGTNKADDAQYKLGLCYMNIGQKDNANKQFNNLMEFYPKSEFNKKAKEYLQSY